MSHGIFITLEGIDGTGKSTHARRLAAYLRKRGIATVLTREPGGTKVGEQIRRLLLNPKITKMSSLTELTLMYAAREQHLEEVVRPALARGQVVISDRYNDASFAYQGYGRGLDLSMLHGLCDLAVGGLEADLTIVLDCDPTLSRRRLDARGSARDRLENERLGFHERVREGFLALARGGTRHVVLDAAETPENLVAAALAAIDGVGSRG